MSDFDEGARRLTLKLVYYGPAMSGKTTNLTRLHDLLSPERKGEIMTLETQNDRTLFFDLLPLGFRAPSGLTVTFKLYTVPGQVAHDGTRKAVLSRADGVVFVADSRATQSLNNAEAFQNLETNVERLGMNFDRLPLVIQYNKRDLPDVIDEAEIRRRWSAAPWPVHMASALSGPGVIDTFAALMTQVYERMNEEFHLERDHGLTAARFVAMGDAAPLTY